METQNKKPCLGFAHLVNAAVSFFVEQTFCCMVRFLCCVSIVSVFFLSYFNVRVKLHFMV